MSLADLDNVTGHFMAHDRRMLCDVLMNSLMLCSEDRALVRGHTYAVRDDLYQNLIIFDFR